jgi:hypothetical protein
MPCRPRSANARPVRLNPFKTMSDSESGRRQRTGRWPLEGFPAADDPSKGVTARQTPEPRTTLVPPDDQPSDTENSRTGTGKVARFGWRVRKTLKPRDIPFRGPGRRHNEGGTSPATSSSGTDRTLHATTTDLRPASDRTAGLLRPGLRCCVRGMCSWVRGATRSRVAAAARGSITGGAGWSHGPPPGRSRSLGPGAREHTGHSRLHRR